LTVCASGADAAATAVVFLLAPENSDVPSPGWAPPFGIQPMMAAEPKTLNKMTDPAAAMISGWILTFD